MTRWLALVTVLLAGCGGSLERARVPDNKFAALPPSDPIRCESLDNQWRGYGFLAKSSAFAGGASGLSTLATDDKYVDIALAGGALFLTAVSVGAAFASDSAALSHTRECER